MRRLLVPFLPLLALACASAPKAEFQEVRRFHPGSDQLQLVYSRWVQPDGSCKGRGSGTYSKRLPA